MDQPGETQMNGQDGAAAVEPVVRVGGRSPSTLSTGCASTAPGEQPPGPLAPGQRWSVARKRAVQAPRRNAQEALVAQGLQPGEKVVVYPSDALRDGARVSDAAGRR